MQPLATHVPLKYTSAEYKYEKIIAIRKEEVCLLSQSSIKELFETNIGKGFPHVLALVHDEAKGQDVYDAKLLGEYLAKNDRWKWLNPATKKTIRKIEYFVMDRLNDGYRLVKKVNTGQIGTAETYESLWFCNNLAAASDPDDPSAFHSMRAMSMHYIRSKDYQKEKEVKYKCFKSIETHYGSGVALLLIPCILDVYSRMLEKLLFHRFDYDFVNDFFVKSPLETLIQKTGMEFFNPEKREESEDLYQISLIETLEAKSKHQSYSFVKCFSSILAGNSCPLVELDPFLKHSNKSVVSLTQAFLCAMGKTEKSYVRNLRESYPDWPLGQAYELSSDILSRNKADLTPGCPIDKLSDLSKTSKDPLLLKLFAKIYGHFDFVSNTWKSKANIYMRMICISRFNAKAVQGFALAIEESEEDNSLSLLSLNHSITPSYSCLIRLSHQQMCVGIKNKNKALYDEGVSKGLIIFKDRGKHNKLPFSIGVFLIDEFTPYRSTKELESIGVKALEYTLEDNPTSRHPLAKRNLAEYFIRKGTTLQAQEAHKWLSEIKAIFLDDPLLPLYFIRYALRFAKNESDLNDVEARLAEIEKTNKKLPLFYLLKALWYSHPLKRNHPEWFILASQNLTKAFKDADQSDREFLIKNLHRFDKLTEEDQTKCKADVLGLLGLGDG